MASYLYGLILARNAERVPPGVAGLGGSTLRVAPCGPLGALVSTVPTVPARPGLDAIRAHDTALRQVVGAGVTAAASRFGQQFPEDAEVCAELGTVAARLTALLDEYDGCVEMRVLLAEAPPDAREGDSGATPGNSARGEDVGPGRAYLESIRAATSTPLKGIALQPALGPVVMREHVEPLGQSGVAFSHLVRRDDEGDYRAAIRALPALAEARVIGPLPLYVFSRPE